MNKNLSKNRVVLSHPKAIVIVDAVHPSSNRCHIKPVDKIRIPLHKKPIHTEVRSLLVRLPDFKSGVGR
jgi:hypothetical protein